MHDTLAMWFRYPGSDRIRGYALWRMKGDASFTSRQLRIARLFMDELALLNTEGGLAPPGVLARLPERFRSPSASTGLVIHVLRLGERARRVVAVYTEVSGRGRWAVLLWRACRPAAETGVYP